MKRLNLDTDKNLTENSNILASSQQALKYYIDQKRVLLNYLQATEPTSFSAGEKWLNTSSNKIFTALSSSTWDNGIDLESGQIYSFNNLLYHWDGENLLIYSSGSVTEIHNNTEVKTWVGTQSEYDAIVTKDPTTEYSITDAYSNLDIILATQTEFNNSATTKAATPYQVNQKMGNYLPLAGGNLNAGAILRLTNANNEVTPLAFDTNGYLTVGSKLYVNTETNTNTLVVRSGNIYKVNTSGATTLWSDALGVANGIATLDSNVKVPSTQLPLATSSTVGVVKPDGSTITVDSNGVITATGGGTGTTSSFPLFYHTFADHLFNNASWLRADTFSWQSGAVYVSAYNHLVNDLIISVDTLYCWTRPAKEVYTTKENPSVGDNVYVITDGVVEFASTVNSISGDTLIPANMQAYHRYSDGDVNNQEVPITAETETISGTTITFYRATDSHKIVLADQESNVSAIYTATGVAWYYVLDTVNTRFKLPRSKWGVVGLRDTVGNYVPESLPNITGYAGQTSSSSGINYSENGALFWASKNYNYPANTTNNTNYNYGNRLALDASRSSSTYQNSAPVQQRATQMYLYFYVGNTIQGQTTIDVGEITEALNDKANTDLSNVTNTGTSTAAGWAMPSSTWTGVTIGASGATYTASHDGWLFLKYNVNSTAIGYVSVTQNGHTDQQVYIGAAYSDCYIFTPIKAGNYNITYANLTFLQANLFHLSGQE